MGKNIHVSRCPTCLTIGSGDVCPTCHPDHIADANKKAQPVPEPLCGGDEVYGCSYHCGDPECAQNKPAPAPASFVIHGDEELSDECGNGMAIATAGPGAFKPAPAPLPEDAQKAWVDAQIELAGCAATKRNRDAVCRAWEAHHMVVSDLTRRLAEAEAERDSLKCEVAAVREIRWSDTVKNFKLLRRERESISYLNRIIRASLSGGHAALELLETERDKERHRAEAAEARVRELEAFKARVMEWAQGRCECCGHYNVGCEWPLECCHGESWTPPQAWEVGE